jgi:hypothetical protein
MQKLNFIILLLLAVNTYGQKHSIGIEGGGNLSNKTSDDFLNDCEPRKGFTAGINYAFHFSDSYSMGLDVLLNQKGFAVSSEFTDEYGNPTNGDSETTFNYLYLSLPVKAGYHTGNKLKGFANIGLSTNILIEAKHITPSFEANNIRFDKETVDVTDQVNDLSLSGIAELGASYEMSDVTLFTSVLYSHDITTFSNEDYFKDTKLRHLNIALSIGLKYWIIKE